MNIDNEYLMFKNRLNKLCNINNNNLNYKIINNNVEFIYKDTYNIISLITFNKLINKIKQKNNSTNDKITNDEIKIIYSTIIRYSLYNIIENDIISSDLFDLIVKTFNINTECISSPFKNKLDFCSNFIDIDKYYGGKIDFLNYIPRSNETFIYINNELNVDDKIINSDENKEYNLDKLNKIMKRIGFIVSKSSDNISLTFLVISLNNYNFINDKCIITNYKINYISKYKSLYLTFIQNKCGFKNNFPSQTKINIINNYINKINEYSKTYKIKYDITTLNKVKKNKSKQGIIIKNKI